MKFAHFADCHVGGWREPKLRDLSMQAFIQAIEYSIKENVDFVIIAGDLLNTSLPSLDVLRTVVEQLKRLQIKEIPVYFIAGSHDYSPSGKTILDVLEAAGLAINIARGFERDNKLILTFTQDVKTGVKLCGILGKRAGLDREFYRALDISSLEEESGNKIFVFHCSIAELKPSNMLDFQAVPLSFLPKNFLYYAGGHIHIIKEYNDDKHKNIIYPGPLFPNSFSELEELKYGGFVIFDNKSIHRISLKLKEVVSIAIDAKNRSSEWLNAEILSKISSSFCGDAIILLRIFGKLSSGKTSDINWSSIFQLVYERGAFVVLKNTSALESFTFSSVQVASGTVEDIERLSIAEMCGKSELFQRDKEQMLVHNLLSSLVLGRFEGERVSDFEQRIKNVGDGIINNNY